MTLPHLPQLPPALLQRAGTPGSPSVDLLMVCMGNICRSPTAEGVLRAMVQRAGLQRRITVDSAGTEGYHVGDAPDKRTQQAAARRGYDLSRLRARQLTARDFERFDLVLVMDEANERAARALCPPAQAGRLYRLTQFCLRHQASAVPDPYYGGAQGFEKVLNLVEDACTGLLTALQLPRPTAGAGSMARPV